MGRELQVGANIGGSAGYSPLDLFHYSASGVRDFSGTTAAYFSINGGVTDLNTFNTNPSGDFGDWAGSTADSYNAYGSSGAVEPVSASDLTLLDVIGYDAASSGTNPQISSVTATAGDYNAGKALTLTLNMSEAVNVTGTPTLTLNDGGSATYASRHGHEHADLQLHGGGRAEHLRPGGDGGHRHDRGSFWQCAEHRQPAGDVCGRQHRHHDAFGVGRGGHRRRLQRRQGADADAQHERGGQRHRHSDADPQRRWQRHLCFAAPARTR